MSCGGRSQPWQMWRSRWRQPRLHSTAPAQCRTATRNAYDVARELLAQGAPWLPLLPWLHHALPMWHRCGGTARLACMLVPVMTRSCCLILGLIQMRLAERHEAAVQLAECLLQSWYPQQAGSSSGSSSRTHAGKQPVRDALWPALASLGALCVRLQRAEAARKAGTNSSAVAHASGTAFTDAGMCWAARWLCRAVRSFGGLLGPCQGA